MSTIKRSRRPQPDAASQPASKRQKLATSKSGLAFLVDEEARKGKKIDAQLTNGVPSKKTSRVDESHAMITAGPQKGENPITAQTSEVINITSGEEEDSEIDEDSDVDEVENTAQTNQIALANGHKADAMEDVEEGASAEDDEHTEEPGEPSFGDMLQARHPQPIDVQALFADPSTQRSALIPTGGERLLAAPSTTSLGTVLTQALKTNDRDLLESCFQVTDLASVRSTVQRLPSQHIATLLQRIAERIHKAPGRANVLMVWVQWSLVAHGGYLAGQPDVLRKLKSLTQVVRERASGLEPLLHLKGKLDMLSAQLELRKSMLVSSRVSNELDDEEAVLYVEAEDDAGWSQENAPDSKPTSLKTQKTTRTTSDSEVSDSEADDDSEAANGVANDSDEDSDGDEDEEGLIDIEAEETSDDEGDAASDDEEEDSELDEEDDDNDDDEDISGDEDDVAVKPPRPQTLSRKR